MSSGKRVRLLLLVSVGLVASGLTQGRAAQTTTFTAPFDEAFAQRGCSYVPLPTTTCTAVASATKMGSLKGDTAVAGLFLPSTYTAAESRSYVGLNYPLATEAFALIITATVHVTSASAQSTPSPGPFLGSPGGYAELVLSTEHATCQCGSGWAYTDVVYTGQEVSDTDFVLQVRVENYNGGAALLPVGMVKVSVAAQSYTFGSSGQGSATTSIDATLVSVKVDVVTL